MNDLTHIDAEGNAVMVNVSAKKITKRTATAAGSVYMLPETLKLIINSGVKKGDVLSVAQLAGIMGAKKTSDLIPLCHPWHYLNLDNGRNDQSQAHSSFPVKNKKIKTIG